VELPVGDAYGSITNPGENQPYIKGPTIKKADGKHYQRRWVQKTDAKGNPVFLSKDEYDALAAKAKDTRVGTEKFADYNQDTLDKASLVMGLAFFALGAWLYKRK
jgi:hypothetical protein